MSENRTCVPKRLRTKLACALRLRKQKTKACFSSKKIARARFTQAVRNHLFVVLCDRWVGSGEA